MRTADGYGRFFRYVVWHTSAREREGCQAVADQTLHGQQQDAGDQEAGPPRKR